MKAFRCTYREPNGTVRSVRIEAETQAEVVEGLAARDYLVLSVVEEPAGLRRRWWRRSRVKIKADEVVLFVRQLATMIDAGMPLLQCLQTLEDQAEPGDFRSVLHGLVEDVTRGRSFSEGLANHPRVFDKLFISMVRAGETGGFLAEILERLATHMENAAALRRKIKSALMYPAVVMTVAVGITVLLLVKVIPVFERMFQESGAELPLPTRVLIGVSHGLREWWFVLVPLMGGVVWGLRWYGRTPRGKMRMDRLKFKVPIFGTLVQKVAIARFSSTLATLLQSGVPIIKSLEIVAESSGNEVINAVLREAMERTERGEQVASALRNSAYIPRMVSKMVEVGESTGRLDQMLGRIAAFYTEQVNTAIAGLTALIEPLLIIFLGVVVGGIMLSMFLPIFKLTTVIS
ncbi:MAG: type II secretion system F family protein [bacterium]|nr:type II secretion system F family protein [bacterium]